ncbi:UDP-2,3-diacylglucosamine diphosphatase LpxI [Paracoccaceae bacterium]|nr:UDP-2,3-diacylglucosamine diphosphatase LpxI [Paracoccaceae bacterium]
MERPEIDFSKVNYGSRILLSKVISILNKGDGEIFSAVTQMFASQSFTLIKIQDLLPELTLDSGTYGSAPIGEKELKEIKAGVKFFLNYAALDIGQSLIFQNGHCLGLETITGTDEMIRSIINFRERNNKRPKEILSGGILIKGSKPDQVLDIDTPVIGPNKIKLAKNAKLNGLVIESNKVILVNRDLIIDTLQRCNMFLASIKFFG